MENNNARDERIRVYATTAQKNQLQRMAAAQQKTLSQFVLDAALSAATSVPPGPDEKDLLQLKKDNYIIKKLLLLVGSQQLKSEDAVMDFYRKSVSEAENAFAKKEV